jgi:uncharacterized protein YaaW (UPF0174 family)
MKKKYITVKALSKLRRKLLKKQNGLCAICQQVPKRPCVDHEHKKKIKGSGRIRGVLCSNCNVYLAKAENNSARYGIEIKLLPTRLRQMADYLEKEQTNFIHPSEKPKKKILKKASYNKLKKAFEKNPGKKKVFPKYNIKKGKPKQILTKQLDKLFKEYKIKVEYYK